MKPSHNILSFDINGSLRKREVQSLSPYTEYYLFNSAANLKAYRNNTLDFAYYGYNAANTRSYKLSMLNQNQWTNGQPEPIHLQLQSAMFYPNAYLNFNQNGEYTKHYYNGSERIASRLGDAQPESFVISSNDRLAFRTMQADQQARADLLEVVEAGDVPIETPSVDVTTLQVSGNPDDIFYYHTNHLGSTAFITDNNTNIHQGFLYAPFGEITTEFNANFGNNVLPKYAFNAKELDEETGMYYYEARYYKPPVFTSRDPMFEKYFWMSPYAYCANNPVKYVDPSGEEAWKPDEEGNLIAEKGDNAWTFAQYLNTSPEIAKKMLNEQGYTVNNKGVLNLKDGDVFIVDYGNETKSSDNLGSTGNRIRDHATKGIAQDLFTSFWQEKGDVKLTGAQFAGILLFIKNNADAVTDKGEVTLYGKSGKTYSGHCKEINFYESNNYSLAFGKATVYTNSSGNIVGFYDEYDFNPQKWGIRSVKNEIKTRMVNGASKLNGIKSSMRINYGYSRWNP